MRTVLLAILFYTASVPSLSAAEDVATLLARLADEDQKSRLEAYQKLTSIGPELLESRVLLQAAAKSENHFTRMVAAQLLSRCDMDIPALIRKLDAAEVEQRREAARELSQIGAFGRNAADALLAAMKDPDRQVRVQAALALGVVKPDPKIAVPALRAFLQDKEKGDVRSALTALGSLGTDAQEAIPEVLTYLKGPYVDPALRALFRMGWRDFAPVLEQLKEADPSVRKTALDSLAQFGDGAIKAVPNVIEHLKDADRSVAFQAIRTLGHIGGKSPEAHAALIEILKAGEPFRAPEAASALGALARRGQSLPEDIPPLMAALKNEGTQQDASNALGQIGAPAVPVLVKTLEDSDPKVRRLVLWALGDTAAKSPEALDAILKAMKAPDPETRRTAARCIWKSRSPIKAAVPALAILVEDPDSEVRWQAVESLQHLGKESREAAPALIRALKDKDLKVRSAAAYGALPALGSDVAPQLMPLARDPDPETRCFVLGILAGFRSVKDVLPLLAEAMKDPESKVRASAASGLHRLGVEGVPLLTEGAKDPDPVVRHICMTALQAIAPDAKTTQDLMQPNAGEKWVPGPVLKGQSVNGNALSFSPDGRLVATGGLEGNICIWNAETGNCIAKQNGPSEPKGPPYIMSLCFSPDGNRLVTADALGVGRVWTVPLLKPVSELKLPHSVTKIVYSSKGDRMAAVGSMSTRLWDTETSKQVAELQGEHISDLAFSPDGKMIAQAAGGVVIFDPKTGKLGAPAGKKEPFLTSVSYAPDGKRLVGRSEENSAIIVDLSSSGTQIVLSGHQKGVRGALFSPDGARVVTVGWDSLVKIWDATTGKEQRSLSVGAGVPFSDAIFFSDGTRLATACGDGAIRIWNVETGVCLATLHKPPFNHSIRLALTSDGTRITATGNSEILIWKKEGK